MKKPHPLANVQTTPKPPLLRSVCLFLPTGKTFTFRNVQIITNNESVLVMNYVAMSDGNSSTITAQKSQIVGWTIKA